MILSIMTFTTLHSDALNNSRPKINSRMLYVRTRIRFIGNNILAKKILTASNLLGIELYNVM